MGRRIFKITNYVALLFSILLVQAFKNSDVEGWQLTGNNPPMMVLTHPSNVTKELSKKQLKSILKGEVVRWPDKKKIVIAIMKSNTGAGKFIAENILNMSPNDMDQFYLMQVFQGKMSAPKTFDSVEELKNFVANNSGVIGITEESAVGETLKLIKINGQNTLNPS